MLGVKYPLVVPVVPEEPLEPVAVVLDPVVVVPPEFPVPPVNVVEPVVRVWIAGVAAPPPPPQPIMSPTAIVAAIALIVRPPYSRWKTLQSIR